MRNTRIAVLALAAALAAGEARAQAPAAEPAGKDPPRAAEPATKDDVRTLAEEVRRLKLEIAIPDAEYRSFAGLGPAASKVYFVPKGLSLGGYGEITSQSFLDSRVSETDLRRVVLYAGYRFSPLVVFNAEIEFEHVRELGVEFAYVDLLFHDAFRLRVGNVLVPIGFVNEMHEPPFFHGVNRPGVERNVIPATWHENGISAHGEVGRLRYKAYLLTGLDPIGRGASAASWLRGARSDGGEARADDWAGVVNLTADLGPASVGGTAYLGRSGQGEKAADGSRIRGEVTLLEAHASLAWRGLALRVLGVVGRLGDADEISTALGLSGADVLGSRVVGAYAEAAYDVLPLLASTDQALLPFLRYEYQDLHRAVPAGGVRNPALETDTVVVGLTYKPLPNVVFKADYQRIDPRGAGSPAQDQVNLGAGFVF
jgi:hypothetical protein